MELFGRTFKWWTDVHRVLDDHDVEDAEQLARLLRRAGRRPRSTGPPLPAFKNCGNSGCDTRIEGCYSYCDDCWRGMTAAD